MLGAGVGVAKSLKQHRRPQQVVELPCPDGGSHAFSENDEDDQYGGSLTKQLAETAVGVREMSKQLGECIWSLDLLSTQQTPLLQDVLE